MTEERKRWPHSVAMVLLVLTLVLVLLLLVVSMQASAAVTTLDADPALVLEQVLSTNHTVPPPSFQGSTVHARSPGMVVYHNVCLVQNNTHIVDGNGNPKTRLTLRLRAYTSNARGLQAPWPSHSSIDSNYRFLYHTEGGSLAEWNNTTTNGVLVDEATLFTVQLFRNPGHCLSDLVFSLAYDRHAHGSTTAPRFVYGTWQQVRTTPYQPDWCFELLQAAGFVGPPDQTMITQKSAVDDSICFRTLLMPLLGLHRFPLDAKDRAAFARMSVLKPFQTRNYADDYSTDDYPVQALEALRHDVTTTLGLHVTPWPDTSDEITILMYTRQGSARRHWTNADHVQAQLERDYQGVRITRLGSEWENLTPAQQWTLYHNYSHILTVHGANQANLMVARPGTRVVEIQCVHPTDPQPDFNLTTAANDSVAWFGPPSWYTAFTRRLGVAHFMYTETTGCLVGNSNAGVHGAKQVQVNVTQFVRFVATRWGLMPR